MLSTRRRDTPGELALRRELYRRGLRYRVDRRPLPALRRRADIVFVSVRVAVFCDGCFWHGCPDHGTWPTSNADWWRAKIERTRERDRETAALLGAAGWGVIRVWEHEDPVVAAEAIAALVSARASAGRSLRAE